MRVFLLGSTQMCPPTAFTRAAFHSHFGSSAQLLELFMDPDPPLGPPSPPLDNTITLPLDALVWLLRLLVRTTNIHGLRSALWANRRARQEFDSVDIERLLLALLQIQEDRTSRARPALRDGSPR